MKDWVDLNRRDFLVAMGAAYGTAACAWAAPRSWFVEYSAAEDGQPRERFVNTLCPMCPGGCGLKVRVVHDCAVGVSGNKNHPVNRGGLCSRASAVLQDLYNPDRLRQPLQSVGGRGSGQWEPIEWDSAFGMIAEKLRTIRESAPQTVCVVLGRDRGLTAVSWRKFMRAFGSPNIINAFPDDDLQALPAVLATHGVRQRMGYDVASAAYVLSFSSAWLDAHWSTEQAARGFADFRRGRPGFRPKWTHIEPRLSLTATKADEWVPAYPGTEGTVALGIAHVILREGLYDRTFVERHSFGFDDWIDRAGVKHLGFRRMILEDYTPTKVEEVSGVPVGDIFRLAREFSAQRPALAIGYDGGGCGTQATHDRMAIHSLNALVGSIGVPGGVTVFQELSLLDGDQEVDTVAARGLASPPLDGPASRRRLADSAVDYLADALETERPYKTKALFLVDADPVFSLAEGPRLGSALSHVPFVVAFSGYHNESNLHADLILPSLHRFHTWDFDIGHTLTGHPVVTIAKPAMGPPPDSYGHYDVVRLIAGRIGNSVAGALPWSDAQEAVDAVCRELFDNATGAAFGPAHEESWAQLLESRGWRAPFAESFAAFKRDMVAGGGWTDPNYFHREWDRIFRAPSGKFAFSSAYLARSFEAIPESGQPNGRDRQCLPDCGGRKRTSDLAYPLDLYVYPLPNLVAVASPNLPWLNDIAGAYMFEKWRTWVEIHPETAAKYGIAQHDRVEVRTLRGGLVLPVKIFSGLMPDVIAIPFGFGRKSGGRWCDEIGENPSELVDGRTDPLTGRALWNSTRASIRKT